MLALRKWVAMYLGVQAGVDEDPLSKVLADHCARREEGKSRVWKW